MLFQTPTPDTSNFLIIAFVVFAVLGGGFLVSLVARFRSLRRDAEMVEELLKESDQPQSK